MSKVFEKKKKRFLPVILLIFGWNCVVCLSITSICTRSCITRFCISSSIASITFISSIICVYVCILYVYIRSRTRQLLHLYLYSHTSINQKCPLTLNLFINVANYISKSHIFLLAWLHILILKYISKVWIQKRFI